MLQSRAAKAAARGWGAAPVLMALAVCACTTDGTAANAAVAPSASARARVQADDAPRVALVIHGGAGTIRRQQMTPEREREYRARLAEALEAGHGVLQRGGSSLDAVVAAITLLEDSPLFNAARGAVFTSDGRNVLDASIMDGASLAAGAVAAVTRVKNPIQAARAVMERSPHVLLSGAGADAFAEEQGLEMVAPEYFRTQARWDALQRAREQERLELSEDQARGSTPVHREVRFGTVGAVALDRHGNLAAGTSTGGMTNKRWGRIGDSPIIGAGTYASNRSCAVSATGHGEYFIRNVVAYDICALVEYRDMPLAAAADAVVMYKLVERGGAGGIIALDPQGNFAMPFNTEGMYRGFIDRQGRPVVLIYRDEEPS
jgi:L-asparaginase / beta-aspartyl-peptidase